ncbi:ATP-dependent RNA helicase DDX18-like [Lutra lutra]|uniref:ATP-dependent RNA helicase DDX18-like n=1 Tax=Lutra lutra TaxID=9657 RepID=UPI001FD44D15|nr:ATP-dependent RNA helicase DDX18-like [Lutra lutra]
MAVEMRVVRLLVLEWEVEVTMEMRMRVFGDLCKEELEVVSAVVVWTSTVSLVPVWGGTQDFLSSLTCSQESCCAKGTTLYKRLMEREYRPLAKRRRCWLPGEQQGLLAQMFKPTRGFLVTLGRTTGNFVKPLLESERERSQRVPSECLTWFYPGIAKQFSSKCCPAKDVGFEEELKQIIKLLPTRRQIMLFSATQTRKVEDLARISLKKEPLYFGVDNDKANATVDGLEQGYVVCPPEKRFLLLFTFLKKNQKKKLTVFFSFCKSVKYHYELLNYIDLPVLAIHGRQKQNKCTTTFFQLCHADSGILSCTDVAARGLDIPEVDRIIQYDPPDDPKEHIHRVGRIARGLNGRGHALLILRPEELGFLHYLKQSKVPLSEFQFSWSKISDIQSQLEKLIAKNYFLHKSAQEAYKSYIRAYDSHSLKQIFKVNNLNLPQVALSFGFKVPPFVDLNVNSNDGKLKKRGGGGGFGYQKAKKVEKSKIFKHISKKSSDSWQFSH